MVDTTELYEKENGEYIKIADFLYVIGSADKYYIYDTKEFMYTEKKSGHQILYINADGSIISSAYIEYIYKTVKENN